MFKIYVHQSRQIDKVILHASINRLSRSWIINRGSNKTLSWVFNLVMFSVVVNAPRVGPVGVYWRGLPIARGPPSHTCTPLDFIGKSIPTRGKHPLANELPSPLNSRRANHSRLGKNLKPTQHHLNTSTVQQPLCACKIIAPTPL